MWKSFSNILCMCELSFEKMLSRTDKILVFLSKNKDRNFIASTGLTFKLTKNFKLYFHCYRK